MPKRAPRPSRWIYAQYDGPLGKVVSISKKRETSGAAIYEVKCAQCGLIHERNAKHLKQGTRSRECSFYRSPNYSGLAKRDTIIRRVYGITEAQYDEMLNKQGGVCAICGRTDEVEGRRLAIDHCHDTGKVRGLLCGSCNRAIGLLQENPVLISIAANYVAAHSR